MNGLKKQWFVVVASAAAIAVGLSGSAAAQVNAPTAQLSPTPLLDTSNLTVVADLDPLGTCLFHHSVYPAGAAGYRDSSLPYDDLAPLDAARETLRAQLLRTGTSLLSEVTLETGEVTVLLSSAGRGETLGSLLARDPAAGSAYRTLLAGGVHVAVQLQPGPSLARRCAWEAMMPLRRADGSAITTIEADDPATGRSTITVEPVDLQVATAAAAAFPDVVAIVPGKIDPNLVDRFL